LKTLTKVELPAAIQPGDFMEIVAEIVRWSDNERHIGFEARRTVAMQPSGGAKDSATVGQVLPHPELVATAEAVCEAPDVPGKGEGLPAPLIVTVAPVGDLTTREDTPHLPLTPDEIAADVARCAVEGATVVHLHARDDTGTPTQGRERYQEIVEKIKARCDVVVQVSTEGDASMDVMTRCQVLDVPGVEMASLTAGTVNRADHISFNSKPVLEHVAMLVRQRGITPCVEICDFGFLENTKALAKKGLVVFPGHFELILGAKGSMGARAETLEHLVDLIPRGSTWSATGVGRHQIPMARQAIALGGHVRVGLEDTVYLQSKVLAQGSAPLAAKVVELAKERGRPVADVATTRKLLRLQKS
jgi:3-keto-5-aminohexanoate cleavage enzyme